MHTPHSQHTGRGYIPLGVVRMLHTMLCHPIFRTVVGFLLPLFGPLSAAAGDISDATRDYTSDLAVFPGAEGFGTNTIAGRGGVVIKVTTLASNGPGSFREAVETSGPRVIVFEVGGVIDLAGNIMIAEPFVAIAGQTAPSPGVSIIGAGLIVRTHDVLIQHLRIRVGDRLAGPDPENRDGIAVIGFEGGGEVAYNVVIDRCSVCWAIDEGASTWWPDVHDITFSNCIIAENLSNSLHPKGEHSKGLLLGDITKRVAVIGNLFVHNMDRNPVLKGDVSGLVVNNIIYNPGINAISFTDPEGSGPSLASLAGNIMIPGADTAGFVSIVGLSDSVKPGTRIFEEDSSPPVGAAPPGIRSPTPVVWVSPLTVHSSTEVPGLVLGTAGARAWDRDGVDRRIIGDVANRTGRIIDSQDEVGGFPDPSPSTRELTLPQDPNGDNDGDGYTNLEEWLHAFALESQTSSVGNVILLR